MPKSAPQAPLSAVAFFCRACDWTFDAAPRVESDPESPHHPWRYYAACSVCGAEVPQASWQRALLKAWANSTGPKTEEGKAASAANLQGHPTPEEARRTRFNAMKHGLDARTATYFPAKPDGYTFCKGCEIDREYCRAQPACVKKTEIFMLHQAAFEQRDPKRLHGVYSDLHAALFLVLQNILQTIIADGVEIVTPRFSVWEGRVIIAEYTTPTGETKTIYNLEQHPLLEPLGKLLSRTGITLADIGMTTKVIEAAEEGELGELTGAERQPAVLGEFAKRQAAALEALGPAVERARQRADRDPVLIEHRQQGGEDR